jgi:hypothetical protein
VTITHPSPLGTPPGFDESLIDFENLASMADRSHLKSIGDKYQGRTTSSATQLDTIATIVERKYALIPFTIDHLGREPLWTKPTDRSSTTNEYSFKVFKFAQTSPQNLLHCVNAAWHELSQDTFGDTYHTTTPSIWLLYNKPLALR